MGWVSVDGFHSRCVGLNRIGYLLGLLMGSIHLFLFPISSHLIEFTTSKRLITDSNGLVLLTDVGCPFFFDGLLVLLMAQGSQE